MIPPVAAHRLYTEYVYDGNQVALKFWGPIPRNIKDAITFSEPLIKRYREKDQPIFTQERLAKMRKSIKTLHQKHQLLTPKVRENLKLIEERNAVVEAGHQPVVLGGPGFIINKLATISKFATLQNSIPIMFVGDHDHEQKELTVIHLPSPGPRGITFSLPVSREYQQSPMHVIPLPTQVWKKQAIAKIASTYHELVSGVTREQKNEYDEQIQRVIQILEHTYTHAGTLSEWTLQIWMRIVNVSRDCGVLFQTFSNPTIRQLMLPAFEYLLSSPNRLRLIQALNQNAEQLQQLGYQPGIGPRSDDFIPFHLECPTKGCNRTRLDPTLSELASHSKIRISAQCPKCRITHSLEVKADSPELDEWAKYLSPRVDTRAFLVQSYTPVIMHVGGAGETDYHAQVSPALEALNSVVPIFFRYTRLYYSNPWILKQAQNLLDEGFAPLKMSELQCYALAIKTAYNEENLGLIRSLFAASGEYIQETANQLIEAESDLERKRREIIIQQRETFEPTLKQEYQSQVGILTRHRQLLQKYLSQMYGRYSPERFGQEVSFAWIDAALSFGPQRLFSRLETHYQELTPAAATFFLADTCEK